MTHIDLPAESQRRLIRIARYTLEDFVRGTSRHVPDGDPYLETTAYGAFVSLFKGGELRGCIGTCTPLGSLRETVMEMTEAAASRDNRVEPIRSDEVDEIQIDISVLSSLERVEDRSSLVVGVHGLHISRKGKRGVLLPQVAAERRWNVQTFLEQTCIKARLPKDAWRWPDTRISRFTALIIEEQS